MDARYSELAVDLTSVTEGDDLDQQDPIINSVDHSIVTDSDPQLGPAFERTGCRRPRVIRQRLNDPLDSNSDFRGQFP